MNISLDDLINAKGNRYTLTKAAGIAIDRKDNIKNYPDAERTWKIVPIVMQMVLDGKIKFHFTEKKVEE